MLIDARSVPENETIETDVCIAGAGIAGITLAREFIDREFRVCLLESGGLGPDRATQSLYWGENVGYPYYPLDTHGARAFGGTSHRWHAEIGYHRFGVRLRPLDPIDFEERDWVPYSGWPFSKAHLDPFYERAHAVCQIGPYRYDVGAWEDSEESRRLPLSGPVETTIFQFGPRDPFYGEYREQIDQAHNLTTYLHANVVEVETTDTGRAATRLRVACLEGNRFSVEAKLFILAMGGIETPRALLLSNKTQSGGLGNQHDLVGRFFMEHPHLWSGVYIPSDPDMFNSTGLYRVHSVDGVPIMGKLALAEEVLRRERLLSYCVSIHPVTRPQRERHRRGAPQAGISDFVTAAYGRIKRECEETFARFKPPKVEVFRLNHMSEQAPNPNSRVTLAAERDVLGCRRAQLDWQMSPLDVRTIIRAQEIISAELQRSGLGHLQIDVHDDTPIPAGIVGGYHQMGTTRMHRDPKQGVVDQNCRVHGVSNLFIAGSSVFPTVGYANPVLTLVALAVRLADHVEELMI